MEKIKSFQIDHNTLMPGLYISRVDGDITTYDLRFIRPNTPPFLSTPSMHTIEHLVATYVRNSEWKDEVIYFGPMGCRTGFYFLARHIQPADVITLLRDAVAFVVDFTGTIPGTKPEECGNYKEHDLDAAKADAAAMLPVLQQWREEWLDYAANHEQ